MINKFFVFLFISGCVAALVLIGISLGKTTYRNKQVSTEIGELQREIDEMREENRELTDMIGYLSTKEFQEKEAREKLNLKKTDEEMLILKKDAVTDVAQESENISADPIPETPKPPYWRDWWRYFFSKS